MILQEVLKLNFRYKIFTYKMLILSFRGLHLNVQSQPVHQMLSKAANTINHYFYFNVEELFFPQTCQINNTNVKTNLLHEHQQWLKLIQNITLQIKHCYEHAEKPKIEQSNRDMNLKTLCHFAKIIHKNPLVPIRETMTGTCRRHLWSQLENTV